MRQQVIVALLAVVLASVATAQRVTPVVKWALPVMNETVQNPLISGFDVIVPTNTSVYLIDLASGMVKWRYVLKTPGDSGGYVSATETTVFIGTKFHVLALDRATGSDIWDYLLTTTAAHARADVSGDIVYVTNKGSPLVALCAKTGMTKFTIPGVAGNHVWFSSGRIFFVNTVGGYPEAVAADAKTGLYLWRITNVTNLLTGDDMVFVKTSSTTTPTLFANHANNTGSFIWQGVYTEDFDYFYSAGQLFVDGAAAHLLDAQSGKQLWTQPLDNSGYLAFGAGAVFALATTTTAYAVTDGRPLWTFKAPGGAAVNSGAAGSNSLVFGTATHIVALQVY